MRLLPRIARLKHVEENQTVYKSMRCSLGHDELGIGMVILVSSLFTLHRPEVTCGLVLRVWHQYNTEKEVDHAWLTQYWALYSVGLNDSAACYAPVRQIEVDKELSFGPLQDCQGGPSASGSAKSTVIAYAGSSLLLARSRTRSEAATCFDGGYPHSLSSQYHSRWPKHISQPLLLTYSAPRNSTCTKHWSHCLLEQCCSVACNATEDTTNYKHRARTCRCICTDNKSNVLMPQ